MTFSVFIKQEEIFYTSRLNSTLSYKVKPCSMQSRTEKSKLNNKNISIDVIDSKETSKKAWNQLVLMQKYVCRKRHFILLLNKGDCYFVAAPNAQASSFNFKLPFKKS